VSLWLQDGGPCWAAITPGGPRLLLPLRHRAHVVLIESAMSVIFEENVPMGAQNLEQNCFVLPTRNRQYLDFSRLLRTCDNFQPWKPTRVDPAHLSLILQSAPVSTTRLCPHGFLLIQSEQHNISTEVGAGDSDLYIISCIVSFSKGQMPRQKGSFSTTVTNELHSRGQNSRMS
jgi:hypothetical protein